MTQKTTIYLPDDLKRAVAQEALRQKVSEAEVIRRAISAAVHRPRPRAGFLEATPFAREAEEHLGGFGER